MDFSIMGNTNVIAQVLGIFFVVVGISIVANGKATAGAVEESVQSKGMMFMWGVLALLIGAVIVVFSNVWTSGLALLVTILGWLALVKGTFILLLPGAAASLYKKYGKSGLLVVAGVVIVVLGLVLLYW
jgi:drug/metabolite transporter (DMT)-like permease